MHARNTVLSRLALLDRQGGDFRVVIETPRGSRNKFSYDPSGDCFELSHVLPEGMVFPFDFGFLPSTLGDDGDPLDVLVFTDAPIPMGCVLQARLVGVIEARQKQEGSGWFRNDRIIAVASQARTCEDILSLADVRPRVLSDLEAFFSNYNRLRGRTFEVLGRHGPEQARKLAAEGEKRFARKQ